MEKVTFWQIRKNLIFAIINSIGSALAMLIFRIFFDSLKTYSLKAYESRLYTKRKANLWAYVNMYITTTLLDKIQKNPLVNFA